MILRIGTYTFEDTGEVKNRALIFGRVVKDAELKSVGSRGTSMLTMRVSPGRDEHIVSIKLWGYDAIDYSDTKKGSTVLVDAYEDSREYQGKTYTDWVALNLISISESKLVRKAQTRKGSRGTVEPENPANGGFTDIPVGDLPWDTGEFN